MTDDNKNLEGLDGAVAIILLDEVTKESFVNNLDMEDVDEETEEELRETLKKPKSDLYGVIVLALSTMRSEGGESEVDKLVSDIAEFIEPYVDEDSLEDQEGIKEEFKEEFEEGLEEGLREALDTIEEKYKKGEV